MSQIPAARFGQTQNKNVLFKKKCQHVLDVVFNLSIDLSLHKQSHNLNLVFD